MASWTKEELILVSTIAEGVRNIREEVLPDIKGDVREALLTSRGATMEIVKLNLRIASLEDAPPTPHPCVQAETIVEMNTKISNSYKLRKILIPIVVVVITALIGFITNNIRSEVSMNSGITSNSNSIKSLAKSQDEQGSRIEKMINAVNSLPQKEQVKTFRSLDEEFQLRIKDMPERDRVRLQRAWMYNIDHGDG
jgi:hypothetical protein